MTDVGFTLALHQLELRAHVHSVYLSRGARPGPSPRGPSDLRPLAVAAGICPPDYALGSAEVRLGSTHVTCGVTALVGLPAMVEEGVPMPPRGDIGALCVIIGPFRVYINIYYIFPRSIRVLVAPSLSSPG